MEEEQMVGEVPPGTIVTVPLVTQTPGKDWRVLQDNHPTHQAACQQS